MAPLNVANVFSLFFLTISFVNSCSLPQSIDGDYYISSVELLDSSIYPDSVLLTIGRTDSSFLEFANSSPWCKVMNIKNGSVSNTIYNCSSYENYSRDYADPDTDPMSTNISCTDNCDGSTATCIISRGDTTYNISSITYNDSDCSYASSAESNLSNISINTFTINPINTSYIVFSSNAVSVIFNDTVDSYTVYDVVQEGDWWYVIPGGYGVDYSPSLYSAVGVMEIALPCCACYSHSLSMYHIETDEDTMTQTMNIKQLTWGGFVDDIQHRVVQLGLKLNAKQIGKYKLK